MLELDSIIHSIYCMGNWTSPDKVMRKPAPGSKKRVRIRVPEHVSGTSCRETFSGKRFPERVLGNAFRKQVPDIFPEKVDQ